MARRKIRLDPAIRVKPEGEPAFTIGLRAFIAANRDAFTLSEVKRMRKAASGGEEVCLGGGAASAFCITRIGKKSSLGAFGEHGGATYAVVTRGDRVGGYTSRREMQGLAQSAACSTQEWRGNPSPAVLVREAKRGTERAIYACIPKARAGFRKPAPGEVCGCTVNRTRATRVLNSLSRRRK